jgi:hypothetical protein
MITGCCCFRFYSLEIWLFRQYISSDFFIPCYYSWLSRRARKRTKTLTTFSCHGRRYP